MTSFVKQVRDLAERNYGAGGDVIIEGFSDDEILEAFKTLDEVRDYCNLRSEQAANCRWGEDSDPEVNRPQWVE